jgi:predicted RNA-binding Zn-ribbon protein involved in translation (DUF1610 family)
VKAIFELEVPKSCMECRLALHKQSYYNQIFCPALRRSIKRQIKRRHQGCPLKIVEETDDSNAL